jgi:hypothetical protein
LFNKSCKIYNTFYKLHKHNNCNIIICFLNYDTKSTTFETEVGKFMVKFNLPDLVVFIICAFVGNKKSIVGNQIEENLIDSGNHVSQNPIQYVYPIQCFLIGQPHENQI